MAEIHVVVTEPIHQAGVDYLESKGVRVTHLPQGAGEEGLLELVPGVDGLITRGSVKITRQHMEASPRLKAIGVHGIGCDHVDLEAARELGKTVLNTPDALTTTVAEMAVALAMALIRNIPTADKAVRAGQWSRKYGDLIGRELSGMEVGVVGMGRIGAATALRLQALGARVSYWSRTRKPELEERHGLRWAELPQILSQSQLITLHIPYTPQTHHLIGRSEIQSMRDGAYLVNTARGKVVDQQALVEALKTGKLGGAALDVFEVEPLPPSSPLTEMDNVILTPHLAASTQEAMRNMALQVAEGVLETIRGGEPENRVV